MSRTAADFFCTVRMKLAFQNKNNSQDTDAVVKKDSVMKRIVRSFVSFSKGAWQNRTVLVSQAAASVISVVIVVSFFSLYRNDLLTVTPASLSADQQESLDSVCREKFPSSIISALPYEHEQPELDLSAESAILIDSANGCILYEKNADEMIPPASMTKLVAMFVVEQEIATGRISYDDVVPLLEDCWAINQPWDSSLMYLAEGQRVTLDELLQGLSVMSGSDAAYALADYTSGSMDAFLERMNNEVASLGLTNTHFVEPSGYSELNMTTARDFVQFSRVYIERYPDSLEKYHSLRSFTYPKEENLPEDLTPAQIARGSGSWYIPYSPRTKSNTNPLLDLLEGCDGLKTGYIDESGYNLALTAKRNGTRFLSITMRGQGENSREGNEFRIKDGTELMEYAFGNYTTVQPEKADDIPVIVSCGLDGELFLVQAQNPALTVPHIHDLTADTPQDEIVLTRTVDVPSYVCAPVHAGDFLGTVTYSYMGTVLETVPLVADRDIEKADDIKCLLDRIVLRKL